MWDGGFGGEHKLRRKLFNFATVLSLLLCAATVVLWVRGRFVLDIFGWAGWQDQSAGIWRGSGLISQDRGLVLYSFAGTIQFDDPSHRFPSFHTTDMKPHFLYRRYFAHRILQAGFVWSRFRDGGGSFYSDIWAIGVPSWVPPLSFAVLPVWCIAATVRDRRIRGRIGSCQTCSYNLTGNTSGVCPECGRAISGDVKLPDHVRCDRGLDYFSPSDPAASG
jgi:hypothetical protein